MLKIVISVRDAIGTGGGSVAINTAKNFSKLGHKVIIVSDYLVDVEGCENVYMKYGEYLKNRKISNKIQQIFIKFSLMISFSIWGFLTLKKLEKKGYISIDHNIESFGGDVIVLHNVFTCQYKSDTRKAIKKVKQFFNPIFSFRIFREWLAVNFGRAKYLVSVSSSAAQEAKIINKKHKKNLIIENGVDLEKFKPLSLDENIFLKKKLGCLNKFIILFVGHEFIRKRLDLVIEALSLLPEEYELWVIGGRFDNIDLFKQMAKNFLVENRVHFIGSVTNPEVYMSAADCFILVSDYETWGMVAIEALATGTPIIMTNVGCAKDVIIEGENGYIVNNKPSNIANAIKLINWKENNYTSYCRNSIEKYSWENVSRRYIEALEELVENER